MKANQFRAGNYVKLKEIEQFNKWLVRNHKIANIVTSGEKPYLLFEGTNFWQCILVENVEPIKLTREILSKTNLELIQEDEYSIYEFTASLISNNDGTVYLSLSSHGHSMSYDIEYLHHLQNFYHLMEGKELEVNLKLINK